MGVDQGESIRFWQTAPLAGVELLSARYIEHRFAPHVHDGYVIGMIMAGAQRYRYRGAEHLAGSGTLVLINPDELHTGHKGTVDGWLYRAFYADSSQILSLLAGLELALESKDRSLRQLLQVYTFHCRSCRRLRSFDLHSPMAMPCAGSLIHSLHEPGYNDPSGYPARHNANRL
jgi:hypothetical protein